MVTHITPNPTLGEREPDVWVHGGGTLAHIRPGNPLMCITANVILNQQRMKDLVLGIIPDMDSETLQAVRNAMDARLDVLDGEAEEAATSKPCVEPDCECAEGAET